MIEWQRRVVLGLLVLAAAWAGGCQNGPQTTDRHVVEITHEQLEALLASPGKQGPVVLIDVRSPARFGRDHVPGALNIPIADLEAGDPRLIEAGTVVVYGRSWQDVLAPAAAKKLHRLGYRQVRVYRGGLDEWIKRGKAVAGENAMPATDRE